MDIAILKLTLLGMYVWCMVPGKWLKPRVKTESPPRRDLFKGRPKTVCASCFLASHWQSPQL